MRKKCHFHSNEIPSKCSCLSHSRPWYISGFSGLVGQVSIPFFQIFRPRCKTPCLFLPLLWSRYNPYFEIPNLLLLPLTPRCKIPNRPCCCLGHELSVQVSPSDILLVVLSPPRILSSICS